MREPEEYTTSVGKRELTRRSFIKTMAGVGLGIGGSYLLGCSAPAQPTATPAKPTATASASKQETPVAVQAAASPKALRTLTFASVTGGALGLMTEVIQKKGIDVKYGIKLDVKMFDQAAAEKSTLLKQTEAGNFPLLSAVNANKENVPIVFFGPFLYNLGYWVVREDSPYKSSADLKGKKIATLDKISGIYTSAQVIAKETGGDFEKDYQIITGAPPAVVAFLERKDVEAVIINEPVVSTLLATGKYRQIEGCNDVWKKLTGQDMFMTGLAAHRPWIEQNKDLASAMSKMVVEAAKYIRQHPEVFEENKDFLGVKDPQALKLVQERMPRIYPDHWDSELVKNAKHIIDRAVEVKIVPAAPQQDIFLIL